jgi:RHS repeat-associated protein
MSSNDACLVWGEGSVVTACLGAATPRLPVPPLSQRATRSRDAAGGGAWPVLASALVVLAFAAGAARAADGGDAWASGPGLPPGAPSVETALGLPSVVYPIDVPPGRRGMAPAIALRYSSTLAHGPAGYGFDLALGSVERSTRLGPPRYDNTDTFVLLIDGQSFDLLPIDGGSTRFRTVIDSGWLLERTGPGPFGAGSTFWVARGGDGRRYRFGADATGTSQVDNFKWGLDRVEDTAGNVMTIAWQASGAYLFPTRIDYAAHPATGLAATNRVEFCWERRGDQARTPAGEVLTHRLHEIRTFAGGAAGRSTTLVYDTAGDLTSALGTCRAGWDESGGTIPGGSTPPAPPSGGGRRMIAPEGARLDLGPSRATPPGRADTRDASFPATTTELLEPPASGLPPSPSILTTIQRGDGRGAFLPPIEYTIGADRNPGWPVRGAPRLAPPTPFVYGQDDSDEDSGLRIVDLNRDGLPDLVQFEGSQQGFSWSTTVASVWMNTGAAYVQSPAWSAALMALVNPADPGASAWFVIKRGSRDRVENGVRFLDVNDDGFVDVVRVVTWFGTGLRKEVFLNTGTGFTGNTAASFAIPDEAFVDIYAESSGDIASDRGVRLADVDGDGRVDWLVANAEWGGAVVKHVYRHNGAGWRIDPRWILPDEPFVRHIPHGRMLDMGVRIAELNGDAFPDIVRAAAVDGIVSTAIYLNSGAPDGVTPTWKASTAWGTIGRDADHFVQVTSAGDGAVYDHGLRVVDADGDGRSEFIAARRWSDGVTTRQRYIPGLTGGWVEETLDLPWLFVTRDPGKPSRDQGLRLVDVDGDGGVDLFSGPPSGGGAWRPNRSWRGRLLLTSYSNGLGGRTTLTWAPAPHTGSIEGGGPAALPYPLPVVGAVTVGDALGGASTTRYAYDGGFYHHRAREFRGFHRTVETTADGAASIETRHAQQPALATAPLAGEPLERIVRRLADSEVFTRTTWTYDTADGLPPLRHPLVRVETALYDWTTTDPLGGTPVRHTATSWSLAWDDPLAADRHLVRREERREGDVDDPADDRISAEEYRTVTAALGTGAAGAGGWMIEWPWHSYLADAGSQVLEETWTAWDGQAIGAAPNLGLVTLVERRGGPTGPPGAHGPGDPDNPVTRRDWDARGMLASETDPLGRVRRIERGIEDPSRTFPEREIDPLGRAALRRFDPRTGLLTRVVDANGRAVEFEYDGFGRRLAEWGPGDSAALPTVSYRHEFGAVPGRTLRWVRERTGQGERTGTTGNVESVAWFDGLGRLAGMTVESPAGRTVTRALVYDAMGRVAREAEPFDAPPGDAFVAIDAAPFARTYAYDAAGRLSGATGPRGATVVQDYAAWTTRRFDPLGHHRDSESNAFGEVVRVRDYEGSGAAATPLSPATYGRDAAGRIVAITDPEGGTTRLSWDALGRRIGLDDAHIGVWAYRYDLAGNLVEETDPMGRLTRMVPDALDRPIEKTLADGRRVTWTYDEGGAPADAVGRVTTITDATGSQSFAYDTMGRVTRWTRRIDAAEYTLATTWDAMGRIVRRDYPGGRTVQFAYDAGGHLAAAAPLVTAIAHNVRGQITDVLYAGGARAERRWDTATGDPSSLVVYDSGNSRVLDLAYGSDADGLLSYIEERTAVATTRDVFAYDGRHRLVHSSGPSGTHAYAYDDTGTPVLRDGIGFERDDPFRRQRLTRTSDGGSFSYDPLGATTAQHTSLGDRLMTYDATGRLTRLESAGGAVVVTSDYDAGGTLVREVVDRPGSHTVRHFPFPGVEARDGRVTVNVQAADLFLGTFDPDGALLLPVSDHAGTTRVVLDGAGAVVARAAFGPCGEPLGATGGGAAAQLARYAGARVQDGTGLVVMGWRHYDPALGRFLEPDPVLPTPLDTQALNRYAYARDNPVNLVDPDGRSPLFAILFFGAIALLDRDTRADVAQSVGLTAASIVLTGVLGPGAAGGLAALRASVPAIYAAAAATVILDSRLGEGVVTAYASLFQDLGMSPRGATIAGRLSAAWLLNSHLQRSAAALMARSGPVQAGAPLGDRATLEGALADRGIATDALSTPTGDAYGTTVLDTAADGEGLELDRFSELRSASGDLVGVYGVRDIGRAFDHGSVAFVTPGGGTLAASGRHFAYGLGGISTQQFARDLFAAGYSGSLFTLTGRASDFMIELVYGPYGGGLAFGAGIAASGDRASGAGP